jgi:protein farnesyltransferase/geranylgeranyltransferase type-1 subunit alpha
MPTRVIEIWNSIIRDFMSHYTLWWYKFHILEQIPYDADHELEVIRFVLRRNAKDYQAWHYRQWIIDQTLIAPDEIPFL